MRTVILIARHNTEAQTRELIGAANSAGASRISVLMIGNRSEFAQQIPVEKVFYSEVEGYLLPDGLVDSLMDWLQSSSPQLILTCADAFGSDIAIRLSNRMNVHCALAITALNKTKDEFVIRRRIYGLTVEAEFTHSETVHYYSIAQDCFPKAEGVGRPEIIHMRLASKTPWCLSLQVTEKANIDPISKCETLLIGGRGLGSANNARKLLQLGGLIGAAVGGTRPAVYNGWFDSDRLIGISGLKLTPKICIIFGASGCLPFVLGIQKSRYLFAVNNDAEAPIFKYCDEGIIADCNTFIEALINHYQATHQTPLYPS